MPEHEYSHKVDELRQNRVETSFYKYGSARRNFGRGYVNALGSHEKCIEAYNRTGNKEYLLDAMNYLMFEFMYPQKDGAFSDRQRVRTVQELLESARKKWRD